MTDVALINPYPEYAYGTNETTIEPPLGLGYLAAIVEQKGLICRIIDANVLKMKVPSILAEIKKSRPKIIGISVNLYSYQISLTLIKKIKKNFPEVAVILGGPTPTSSPQKMLIISKADAVCVGEGEATFGEILDHYQKNEHLFKKVSGVVYTSNKKTIRNDPREFIKNINQIPFPAYHLFPNLDKYKSRTVKTPFAPLLTSRGCPFRCVFCSKDVFKNYCRMRSADNVIKEIDYLVNKFGIKQIDILDDNFTLDKKRTKEILDLLIKRNYNLYVNLQSGVRTEGIDKIVINKMKKAKIFKIPFGVESGNPEILRNIRKQLNLNKVLKCTLMAKEAGIKVYGFFIIGLPGDTAETMQQTIDFAIKMNPNVANFTIAIPFPGTELYNTVKEKGRFLVNMDDGINAGFYANQVFYELEGMNKDDVLKYYKKAMKSFYFRPIKIWELIISMTSLSEIQWFIKTSILMLKKLFVTSS